MKIIRQIGSAREELDISVSRAKELGISLSGAAPRTVAWLMEGLLAPTAPAGEAGAPSQTCSLCGTTRREVVLYRQVGCVQCYQVFDSTIERLLQLQQEEPSHRGRIPQRLVRYRTLFLDRERLKLRLNQAVEEEDFETAASVRDELESL